MKILGLSFDYHDSAAALIDDGIVVAAAQEERFTRKKNDSSLPRKSIDFCLQQASISITELDQVVFYENPYLKFDRIIKSAVNSTFSNDTFLQQAMQTWIHGEKLDFRKRITDVLGVDPKIISSVDHHQSHASSAYYCSPFDEATIITIDGVGEHETHTTSFGSSANINKLYSSTFPNSLGLFYSAFTSYLGFPVNDGEYRVMGMAAYGDPVYYSKIKEMINVSSSGVIEINSDYFNFENPETIPYRECFVDLFGIARDASNEENLPTDRDDNHITSIDAKRYADIAASAQMVLEEAVTDLVKIGVQNTGCSNVALAGGVALNSVANRKISENLNINLFVQPAAGDAGNALGAALNFFYKSKKEKKKNIFGNPYLGECWNSRIGIELEKLGITEFDYFEYDDMFFTHVAELILGNKVIGWMDGRFEWGPRALGARSILGNPSNANMKEIINSRVKFREAFRPFAPSVISEEAHKFFEVPKNINPLSPESYMLSVAKVKSDAVSSIPAVTHVDGTARLQIVHKCMAPRYHSLISELGKKSGVPIVVNTSFNLKGEPVVASPYDAVNTFDRSEIDYLVMGNHILSRRSLK